MFRSRSRCLVFISFFASLLLLYSLPFFFSRPQAFLEPCRDAPGYFIKGDVFQTARLIPVAGSVLKNPTANTAEERKSLESGARSNTLDEE